MFVATGVGCTGSPRQKRRAVLAPRADQGPKAAFPLTPGRPRCHPEPGRPFLANVGEGSAVRPARVGCPLYRPRPAATRSNLSRMNSYAKCAATPCRMRTSKIIGLKVSWNEHLQKKGGRGALRVRAVLAARANDCYPAATRATRSRRQAADAKPRDVFQGSYHASKRWGTSELSRYASARRSLLCFAPE
jgi:hypothetical protein